jgi:hypothetical protein
MKDSKVIGTIYGELWSASGELLERDPIIFNNATDVLGKACARVIADGVFKSSTGGITGEPANRIGFQAMIFPGVTSAYIGKKENGIDDGIDRIIGGLGDLQYVEYESRMTATASIRIRVIGIGYNLTIEEEKIVGTIYATGVVNRLVQTSQIYKVTYRVSYA